MSRTIDADALLFNLNGMLEVSPTGYIHGDMIVDMVNDMPTIEPERKKDTIQKFHDYQVEWLKSHYDIELEPQLEEMIIRFLHDTANRYMMEIDREEGKQK